MDKKRQPVKPVPADDKKIHTEFLKETETIHPMTHAANRKNLKLFGGIAAVILAGILSGYFLSGKLGVNTGGETAVQTATSQGTKVVGSSDTKTFRDNAEGTLESGGLDGHGTHKLIRPGGVSQTVYLTSSVLDLNQFVGKKVRVWGETNATQNAGWFMDIGKVEVLQ